MNTAEKRTFYKKPVWDPKRGSYGNNLWTAFSSKINRRVKLYSDLEYHHWLLVESDPLISDFCEQPVKATGQCDDGTQTCSYIDMWVLWRNGTEEYREIKYEKDLSKTKVLRQIEIQRAWCDRRGAAHAIYTEKEIYSNRLLLNNWKVVLCQMATARDLNLRTTEHYIMQLLSKGDGLSIGELSIKLPQEAVTNLSTAVFRLLHAGELSAPLHAQELTNETIFRRMENA